MGQMQFVLFLSVVSFCTVAADFIICGTERCTGGSPYCCTQDDGTMGCCWDSLVYQMWWFWFVWIIIFCLVLGCSLACWRRRRVQYRYVVMNRSAYPAYGTVVHNSPATMAYPAHTAHGTTVGTAPVLVKPPSYETAEATKPPPYSAS